MPDGVYLSLDRFQQLNGDLFASDARKTIGDVFEQQAMAAAPALISDAQQQADAAAKEAEQQRQAAEQASRELAVQQFEASVPETVASVDPGLAAHLGGGTPSDTALAASPDVAAPDVAPTTDVNAAPAPAPTAAQPAPAVTPTAAQPAPAVTPTAPVTAPLQALPGSYQAMAQQAAQKYGVDPDIFTRQIQQESGFNPGAKSPAGAIGIAQFMPATAQGMGVDPTDPAQALDGAARLMAQNLQRYGGDYSKALAAYNAGPGNVDKYGGVPPFAETQQYVSNILGNAGQAVQQKAQDVAQAVQNVGGQVVSRVSQFAMGLSPADAAAFCGPAAAIAFAKTYGRNPTTDEAKALAAQVGWNPAQGMAGVQSEQKLLDAMGVPTSLETTVDWNHVAQDAAGGNPVILDTPGHYYYVDGVKQGADGQQVFHVGTSGTDLKGGGEWMTAAQISAMPQSGGAVRAALYADHPLGPGASIATAQSPTNPPTYMAANQPSDQTAAASSNPIDAFKSKLSDAFDTLLAPLQNVFGQNQPVTQTAASAGPSSPLAPVTAPLVQPGIGSPLGALQQAGSAVQGVTSRIQSPDTGNPLLDALGTGASALGTVAQTATSPFAGASEQFPTGGPLAGPGVGVGRQVAGFEQLTATNPEYAQLAAQRDALLAQQPANAAAAGGPDVIARAAQIRDIEAQMRQIASQADIPALAQQNPNIGAYETQGSVVQALGAAPLVAGEAPLAARAVASVIDPGTGLPAVAGRGLEAIRAARQPAAASVGLASGADVVAGAQRIAQDVLAPLKNTPPQVQSVIRDFVGQMAEAQGQADTLALQTRSLLGANDTSEAAKLFEKTGQFVANPTAEQAQHAAEVGQFMQDTGDLGRQAGYIKGDVTAGGPGAPANYFPHSYESGPTIPGTGGSVGISAKGGLNPKGSYSNARTFGTLEEAQANGYTPVNSVSEPLRDYATNVLQSQAKAQVIARIKAIAPDAVIDYVPGARLPEGYVPGAAIDPQLSSVALQQPIATALNNIVNRGGGSAAAKGIMDAMGTAKEVMLSLSPFHLVTELRQAYRANNPQDAVPIIGKAIWNMWSPNYDAFRLANSDLYEEAMRAGVTQLQHRALSPDIEGRLTGTAGALVRGGASAAFGAAGGYSETKREGGTDQQALQNALISGGAMGVAGATVARPLADALFSRVIPTMKALTYGLKVAGGADPQAAATFVNQTFGGQNLAMIARSPTTQQFLRVGMLAPDWWEGWGRQIGGAFNPGDVGTMSRGYWARTLVEAGIVLEGLNWALTGGPSGGHLTTGNGPNHQFDLETTALTNATDPQTGEPTRTYADVLGPLKNIAQLAASPFEQGGPAGQIGTFAHNKLGLLPSTALTLVQNTDPATHQQIVPPGTPAWKAPALILENVLSRLSPITAGQTMKTNEEQGPGAAAVSAGLGLRLSSQSPSLAARSQAFQQKQSTAEALQNNPPATIAPDIARTYINHGIAIPPPPSTIALGGGTNTTVAITPTEQVQHRQYLNEALNRDVPQLLQDPSFVRASRVEQERGLKTVLANAEKEARGRLLDGIPSADLTQRATTAIQSQTVPRAPISPARRAP